jgi:Pyruvate/2-oxoacid:ferredoxin oxidoreductase gamma subunit
MPVQAQLAKDPKQVYDINAILEWLQSLAVQPEQPAFAAKPSQPTSPGYQVLLIDAQEICTNLGSGKVLNVVLLGAALAAGVLGVQEASLITALEVLLPAKLLDMNLRALEAGKAVSNQT